jgi:hypothetical protein
MSITDENIRKITKFAMLKFIADCKTEKKITKVVMLKISYLSQYLKEIVVW